MKAHYKLDLLFGSVLSLIFALPFVASDAGLGLVILTVFGPIVLGTWLQADACLTDMGHKR